MIKLHEKLFKGKVLSLTMGSNKNNSLLLFFLLLVTSLSLISASSCSDSDKSFWNSGNNPNNYGELTIDYNGEITVVKDYCSGGGKLAEFYCTSEGTGVQYYTCSGACLNGECVSDASPDDQFLSDIYQPSPDVTNLPTSPKVFSCLDSDEGFFDRGKNFYEKGIVSLNSNGDVTKSTDYCSGGGKLAEFYCTSEGTGVQYYECPISCSNGACQYLESSSSLDQAYSDTYQPSTEVTNLPTDAKSCAETDGGNKPNKKGDVILNYRGTILKQTDSCMNDLSLQEYYCLNDAVAMREWECENGCSDGSCQTGTIVGEVADLSQIVGETTGSILGGVTSGVTGGLVSGLQEGLGLNKYVFWILFVFILLIVLGFIGVRFF